MKFELKNEVNTVSFLTAVDRCKGEVFFESEQGDKLNLKSQLCKYLFLTLKPGDAYLTGSRVECSKDDGERLAEYLVIAQ